MNSTPPPGTKVISFSLGELWIDENDFCRILLKGGLGKQMGVAEIQEMGVAVFDLCEGKQRKHLIDARGTFGSVLPGAREEIRNNKNLNASRSAAAMITDSMANKLMINFFIQFNKPPYPYRAFENPDEAVKWLKSL